MIEGTQRYGKPAADSLTALLYAKVDPSKPFVCDMAQYVTNAPKFRLVQRYSLVCQDAPALLPKEREIWQAYQYNVQNKLPIAENVQKVDNDFMLYTAPVTINEKLVGMWSVLVDKKELVKEL